MKPFCSEPSYNVPVRIVRVFLFVITLTSFLLKSVPAQCDDITFTLETMISDCGGCDLYSNPNQSLFLSGPAPVAVNSIDSSTSGSVTYDCPYGTPAGSIDSFEYTDATGYVFFGLMGLAMLTQTEESPQYIKSGAYPCPTISNPATARAFSFGQVGFQDVLHMTFPGAPAGTKITVKFKRVFEFLLTSTNPINSPANAHVEIWNPHETQPFTFEYDAPAYVEHTDEVILYTFTGDSFATSVSLDAVTHGNAGWSSSWGVSPAVWLPTAVSRAVAMNTVALYIDVLTPGASYFTNSGTIYPTSDSVHLDISLAGTGSGAVKSSPAGIDCGLTCSHYYLPGTTINLAAVPAADGSIFSGWSGNPTCIDGSVFMTTTKSCTATFDLCPGTTRTQIGSTNYDSINLAYGGAATTGDTIKVLASNQQEGALDFNSGKSVALIGGYDCLFNNIVSYTVVTGSITISNGDVTIGNIVIL